MAEALKIEQVTPTLGAEISGIDLRKLTTDETSFINQALLDHGVIFFRDQNLTEDEHIELGRRFGDLHVHPYQPTEKGHPEIYRLEAKPDRENYERYYNAQWHADVTCSAEPPMGAILLLREIPGNGGGDTLWCNTHAAYDALSDEMKEFLAGLTAVHGSALAYQKEGLGGKEGQETEVSEHPVIRTHPVTGRQALYVNSVFTKYIVQLEPIESDAILQMLFRHIESPRFHCRFRWAPGSVAFWDNRATQHRAIGDYPGFRRHGQRVTLCGDRPFYRATQASAPAGERLAIA